MSELILDDYFPQRDDTQKYLVLRVADCFTDSNRQFVITADKPKENMGV